MATASSEQGLGLGLQVRSIQFIKGEGNSDLTSVGMLFHKGEDWFLILSPSLSVSLDLVSCRFCPCRFCSVRMRKFRAAYAKVVSFRRFISRHQYVQDISNTVTRL